MTGIGPIANFMYLQTLLLLFFDKLNLKLKLFIRLSAKSLFYIKKPTLGNSEFFHETLTEGDGISTIDLLVQTSLDQLIFH
jgi:hypothetical protein